MRAALRFVLLTLLLAALAGGAGVWWSRRKTAVPPVPADLTAEFSRRWREVRFVFAGGLGLRIAPRHRVDQPPVGGLGSLVRGLRAAQAAGPRASFAVLADLDPRPEPVPVDASEEPGRRREEILSFLHAAGLDLLVMGAAGDRRFWVPGPAGWSAGGRELSLELPGGLPVGFTLDDAATPDAAARLRAKGARLVFWVAPVGTPTDVPRRDHDFVVISGPDPAVAAETPRHVSFRGDASLGRVLDLRVPRRGPPGELGDWAELDGLRRRVSGLDTRRRTAGSPAEAGMIGHAWGRYRRRLEALEGRLFVAQSPLVFKGRLPPDDPGYKLERRHRAEDFARYDPAYARRDEPYRTAEHPGTASCATCHREIASAVEQTHHGFAFRALERVGAERSPACVTCHSTGFDPTGETGWSRMDQLKGNEAVGCTACHGAEADPANPAHPWGPARGCEACHTPYASPFFDPEKDRWRVACGRVVEWMKARRPRDAAGG